MNEKLEKLNQKIEETEKKLRWAQLYTGRASALRFAGSPLQGADDFRRFSICSNHHRGSFTSSALAAASYPFVDLPPGNTLRCKLFPSSKFTIHLFQKESRGSIIEPKINLEAI